MDSLEAKKIVSKSVESLYKHMINESYKEYDPYDTLLSPVFKILLINSRIVRFGDQQVCRRIPINFRKPLMIKKRT